MKAFMLVMEGNGALSASSITVTTFYLHFSNSPEINDLPVIVPGRLETSTVNWSCGITVLLAINSHGSTREPQLQTRVPQYKLCPDAEKKSRPCPRWLGKIK